MSPPPEYVIEKIPLSSKIEEFLKTEDFIRARKRIYNSILIFNYGTSGAPARGVRRTSVLVCFKVRGEKKKKN